MILASLTTGSRHRLAPYGNKVGLQSWRMVFPDRHYGPELGRALRNACDQGNTLKENHGRMSERIPRFAATGM